jgi:hypothetical protein
MTRLLAERPYGELKVIENCAKMSWLLCGSVQRFIPTGRWLASRARDLLTDSPGKVGRREQVS